MFGASVRYCVLNLMTRLLSVALNIPVLLEVVPATQKSRLAADIGNTDLVRGNIE